LVTVRSTSEAGVTLQTRGEFDTVDLHSCAERRNPDHPISAETVAVVVNIYGQVAPRHYATTLEKRKRHLEKLVDLVWVAVKFPEINLGPRRNVTAYYIACAYALMNKRVQAIKWLESTAADGFPCYLLFTTDPNLNNLRQEPRFENVHGRIKTAVGVLQNNTLIPLLFRRPGVSVFIGCTGKDPRCHLRE